jgi:hypothetical protein
MLHLILDPGYLPRRGAPQGELVALFDEGRLRKGYIEEFPYSILTPYWVVGGIGVMPKDEGNRERAPDGQVTDVPEDTHRVPPRTCVGVWEGWKIAARPRNGRGCAWPWREAVPQRGMV